MKKPKIIPVWPSVYSNPDADPVPPNLIGATIIAIGTVNDGYPEQDGLVIDFKPKDSDSVERITLNFTELGMWIHWDEDL